MADDPIPLLVPRSQFQLAQKALQRALRSVQGDGAEVFDGPGGIGITATAPQRGGTRSSQATVFAKLTGSGSTGAGSYTGEQVKADGTSLTNGMTFDANQSDASGDIHDPNGVDGWYNDSTSLIVTLARGVDTNDNQYWVIDGFLGTSSSPATVGASDEGESADTDSWDRTSQGANDGVTVTALSRMAYDDAGDETLYAFYRDYKYDSLGYLYEITQETRVTIDTPEAC